MESRLPCRGESVDVVRVEQLDYAYRRFPWSAARLALRSVTLSVARGELLLLAGANGAGKSTLLQIVAGLLAPSGGRVELFGGSPGAAAASGRLAWMPEAIESRSRLRVHQQVELAAAFYGWFGATGRERAAQALDEVGLAALADRRGHTLSKGERRRVAVACTLVSSAELLLLDEPLDGVDPESSEQLLLRLVERAAAGQSVLLSSHVLLDAHDGVAGPVRMAVLDRGALVATGSPRGLLRTADGTPRSFATLLREVRAPR